MNFTLKNISNGHEFIWFVLPFYYIDQALKYAYGAGKIKTYAGKHSIAQLVNHL